MSKRIVLAGYLVTPQLGLLDDEDDTVEAVQIQPIQVKVGGLNQFETVQWPAQLASIKSKVAAELQALDTPEPE
jgi:hypothetical protein